MVKMCMNPNMEFIHHIKSLSSLTFLKAGKGETTGCEISLHYTQA